MPKVRQDLALTFTLIEVLPELLDEEIQLMEIDIGEQWRDHATL